MCSFEGFIEGLDAKAEEESVPVTAATPQEEEASERAPEEGKEDQSSVVTGAVSQWSHVSDVLANIQMDREREFLEQMCAPLAEMGEDMPQESAQSIVDELAEILRQKVSPKPL